MYISYTLMFRYSKIEVTCIYTSNALYYIYNVHVHVHDVIRDVERKKERKTPEANGKTKMRVASGGIPTHDTLYSRQMLYQLSYQGSPAGRVRIKHLIRLYEQADLTLVHVQLMHTLYMCTTYSTVHALQMLYICTYMYIYNSCILYTMYSTCRCIHTCTCTL